MDLERISDKVVECDVLVVGGGIAGCCAAAKAADNGMSTVLAEKSKPERSGSASCGIDHYGGAFERGMTPKKWRETIDSFGHNFAYGMMPWAHPERVYRQYANGMWCIEELEKLGVTMKWTDGDYRPMECHHEGPFLRVHWQNVKPEMAKGVRKRGVNVLDRTMVVDLLTNNGAVTGATAINVRTGEFIVIKAKAVVMATAQFMRLYVPPTYKWQNVAYEACPASISGDGWGMVYRAGAELANMEQSMGEHGFREGKCMSWGNHGNEGIPAKQLNTDGVELPRIRGRKQEDIEYMSLTDLPEDFHKRIEMCYLDERMGSFKISQERGFDFRNHWFELSPTTIPGRLHMEPGIWVDGDYKATLKGLYAAGDCVAGNHDVANGAVAGFLIGDSIKPFVDEAPEPVVDEAQLESQKETAMAPLTVKNGQDPVEIEMAIRYACNRYIGMDKSEGKLLEGKRRLNSVRRDFFPRLQAKNPHYLMRAMEVRNIMDVAEAHLLACLERTESRGWHTRIDYPDADPAWDDMLLYQRLEDGKPVFEKRKLPPMTLLDDHKEER